MQRFQHGLLRANPPEYCPRVYESLVKELQKQNLLGNARAHFERALQLSPDNVVAHIDLACNQNLQAGRKASPKVSKFIEDEFGKYRNWEQVIGENGPFDDPNFCYEQGRVFVRGGNYRQAAQEFSRAKTLDPENLPSRLWLAQLSVAGRKPEDALKIVDEIHANSQKLGIARSNLTELMFVESSAHLAMDDVKSSEAAVAAALKKYPGDEDLLATATQVYLNYGRYSNALDTIEEQLKISPDNPRTLINKGYACIQLQKYEEAIPPLTRLLSLETNNYSALLNRAIAYLRSGKLEAAQRDYEVLQKAFPTAFQIYYGLGEIAYQKKETNAAIRNYQLYLTNSAPNTEEAKSVKGRLKELKPGSS